MKMGGHVAEPTAKMTGRIDGWKSITTWTSGVGPSSSARRGTSKLALGAARPRPAVSRRPPGAATGRFARAGHGGARAAAIALACGSALQAPVREEEGHGPRVRGSLRSAIGGVQEEEDTEGRWLRRAHWHHGFLLPPGDEDFLHCGGGELLSLPALRGEQRLDHQHVGARKDAGDDGQGSAGAVQEGRAEPACELGEGAE